VAIGSNMSDPQAQVQLGFERLAGMQQSQLIRRSHLYATRPLGPQDQADYVNAVAGLITCLSPRQMLDALLDIERAMGRVRSERWGPRSIDLDLIWMVGTPVAEPGLTVPHPGVSVRNFVLSPLADVAPTLFIPGHGRVQELKVKAGDAGSSMLESS
jgi:2-amino-4-hydroxy-6-hydroxymethyldihydropteridine diphosphokinase